VGAEGLQSVGLKGWKGEGDGEEENGGVEPSFETKQGRKGASGIF